MDGKTCFLDETREQRSVALLALAFAPNEQASALGDLSSGPPHPI
jgi:hypothetical protein